MPARFGRFVAALFGCAVTLAGEAQPAGPLPNASFEQAGTDGLPVGFRKYVYGAQPTIAFDSQVKKDGRQSLRVSAEQPSDTAVAQDIQLKPGAGDRFTGWVRTSDLAPEPRSLTHGTFQIQDAAIREGDWKLVTTNDRDDTAWELHDLSADRSESHNLAKRRPEVAERLREKWRQWAEECQVVPFPEQHDSHKGIPWPPRAWPDE